MALSSDYTAGTVSLTTGTKAVTGTGTAWQTAQFQEGDWFIAGGYTGIIASVDSETGITLVDNWEGDTLSGASYRLRYMSDGSRASAQARQLIDMLSGSTPLGISLLTAADAPAARAAIGAVGNLHKVTTYTSSGAHSFDAESTLYQAILIGAGGGGGGSGGAGTAPRCSGGGGGGAYKCIIRSIPSGRSATVTVGAGGAGGSTSGGNGSSGGTTSLAESGGITWNSGGGGGGTGDADGSGRKAGGGGGAPGAGGDIMISGQAGGDGVPGEHYVGGGGASGAGFGAATNTGAVATTGAVNGARYGGGGTGCMDQSNGSAKTGGAGADGIVIIWEFK